MNIHLADKLLCVARMIAGNIHADYNRGIHFEAERCRGCEGLMFCKKVERLIKREIKNEQ